MKKVRDLTGMIFGKWTVIKDNGIRNHKRMWICRCACGKQSIVAAGNLISGKSNGCDLCYKFDPKFKSAIKKRWNNYFKANSVETGDKFDRLTVIQETDKRYFRQKLWVCKCSCGKEVLVTSGNLKAGRKRSCGCLIDEARSNLGKSRIGPKNPRWRSDLTNEDRRNLSYKFRHLQNNPMLVEWRNSVFKRDKFNCQVCGKNGGVNSHHLFSWGSCKEKRYDTDNGITMCRSCHKKFHEEFGWGNNTPDQYSKFKSNYDNFLTTVL